MRHTALLAALAGLSLAGCAGMSESECQYSDWRAVGYEDGARGRGAEEFGRHRKSCAEHGVAADFPAWHDGRTLWDLEVKRAIVEKQLADARQEILARR